MTINGLENYIVTAFICRLTTMAGHSRVQGILFTYLAETGACSSIYNWLAKVVLFSCKTKMAATKLLKRHSPQETLKIVNWFLLIILGMISQMLNENISN